MNRRWFGLLLLCAAANAQEKGATIAGTVVNWATKAPLRKVEITLSNGQISQEMAAAAQQVRAAMGEAASPDLPKVTTKTLGAVTDASGRFRFENVPAGDWWVSAIKAGYQDGRYPAGGGSFKVAAGQEAKALDLRLVPYATLSGRVLDEDGDPYPYASVVAVKYLYASGRPRIMPVDMSGSNSKGEFSFGRIPPGRYLIRADAMAHGFANKPPAPADGSPETAYAATYFPNALEEDQAQKIDVPAGAELTGFNIQLRKSRVVRVRGRVTDAGGEPLKGAQIMLIETGTRAGHMSLPVFSDAAGKFEMINVLPGVYTVSFTELQSAGRPKMGMELLVVPDSNLDNITLGAQPEIAIRGNVVMDDGSALSETTVRLVPSGLFGIPPAFAKVGEDGRFTLEHVAPAAFDLRVNDSRDETYLKSVMFNDREALGQVLDCTAGSGTLRITVAADSGNVDSSVTRDDRPVPNARVVLLPVDPARRFPETVRKGSTDQDGHLTIKGVPPGEYLAFAWEQVEEGAWFDPDFVRAAQDKAARVRVEPRGSLRVQMKIGQ